jgi:RHS repeat-associated protein
MPPPVVVPDFSISTATPSVSVNVGASTTVGFTLNSLNGYQGNIVLSCGSSSLPNTVSLWLSSEAVRLTPATPQSFSLLITVPAGTHAGGPYLVDVTATDSSGSPQHIAYLLVTITAPPAPAFTLTPVTATVNLLAGSSNVGVPFTLTSLNGYSGTISLATSGTSLPTGLTFSFSSPSVNLTPSNSPATVELTAVAASTTPAGTYTVTLTATDTSGTASPPKQIATITVVVAPSGSGPPSLGFSLSPTAASLSVPSGSSATTAPFTLSPVNTFGNYSGTIQLSTMSSGLPSSLTFSFSTNPVNLTSSSSQQFTMTATAAAGTPVGPYNVTIVATDAAKNIVHTAAVAVTVTAPLGPAFTLTPATSSVTVAAGSTATANLTLTSLRNYKGTVNLSVSGGTGLPAGLQLSFANPSVLLTPAFQVTVPLTINAASVLYGGSGTVTVTAADASGNPLLTVTAQVTITVTAPAQPNFALAQISPATSTLAAYAGSSNVAAVFSLTSLNSYSGAISLSVTGANLPATGLTLTLSSPSVGLTPSNSPADFVLTATAASGAANGSYTVTVTATDTTGTASQPVQTIPITVTVNSNGPPPAGFTLSPTAAIVAVSPGSSVNSTFTLGTINTFGPYSGSVQLMAVSSGLPSGLSFSFSSNPVSIPSGGSSTFTMTTTAAPGTVASGPYNVTLVATDTTTKISHTSAVAVSITGPNFALNPASQSLPVTAGTSANATCTVVPSGGYTGTVGLSLSTTTPAPGVTLALSTSSVNVTSAGPNPTFQVTATTLAGTSAGSYTVTVTAKDTLSALQTTATILVTVVAGKDFSVTVPSTPLKVTTGSSASELLAVASLLGYSGTVQVSTPTSGLPSGLTCTVSPASFLLAANGSQNVQFTASAASTMTPGNSYNISVTAQDQSGHPTHTVTVPIQIVGPPDFSLTPAPASVNVTQGASNTFSVTVAPLNGYAGTVNLTASTGGQPTGLSVSPGSAACNFATSSASQTVTLTVAATSSTPSGGPYYIAITGTDSVHGSPTHTIQFPVYVEVPVHTPPTVTLIASPNPASAPAAVLLTANASAAAGYAIQSVQFYNGSMLLGTATASPYTYTWTGVLAGTYSLTAVAADNSNLAANSTTSAPVSLLVTTGSSTFAPLWIDCGSQTPFTDPNGTVWASDVNYASGGAADTTSASINGVASTPPPAGWQPIYQVQRVGTSFTYTIPTPANLTLGVTLDFADIEYTAAGQGVFNVTANGVPVLSGFDIVAAAGSNNTATTKTFLVSTGTAGQIVLNFTATTGNAAIAAIQVGPPGGGEAAPDVVVPDWASDVLPGDGTDADGDGPSSADGVNLASGVYENSPGIDIAVRNPVGPGAAFGRYYRSALARANAASPGLSWGWVDNYDVTISEPLPVGTAGTPAAWPAMTLRYPDGGAETLTPTLSGSSYTPTGAFTVSTVGAPYYVTGSASAVTGQWNSITIHEKDESQETFTPFASTSSAATYRLTQITNAVGRYVALKYDGLGRLLTVTNDATTPVQLLTCNYNATTSYLASVQDCYGREIVYTFGSTSARAIALTQVSQIVSSTNPPSTPPVQWYYDYNLVLNEPYLSLVGVPDPSGTYATVQNAIGWDLTNGTVGSITDATGATRVFAYHGNGTTNTPGSTTISVYNPNGTLAQTWNQDYDGRNRDTGTVDALSEATGIAYADAPSNNPASTPSNPNPFDVGSVVDENGQAAWATYDAFGNLTSTDAYVNGSLLTATTAYNYSPNPLGLPAKVVVGSKSPTSFGYTPQGLLQSISTPAPNTVGGTATITTSYAYDALGNVTVVNVPAPNAASGSSSTVAYTYNYTVDAFPSASPLAAYSIPAANNYPEALGEPLSITDPLGNVVHMRYDSFGRMIYSIDADGNVTQFAYNIADQLQEVVYPNTEQINTATGQPGLGQAYTLYAYRYPGGPLETVTDFDDSGSQVHLTDYGLDTEGAGVNNKYSLEPQVQVQYDGRYRVTQIADGNGHTTQSTFDPAGNLTSIQYPGKDSITFPAALPGGGGGYDAAGNLMKQIDGRGVAMSLTRAYGPTGDARVTNVGYVAPALPPGASPTSNPPLVISNPSITPIYDAYGRVSSLSDGAGTYAYTYDDLDEVTSVTTTYNNVTAPGTKLPPQTVSYSYYANGERYTMSLPSFSGETNGGAFTYAYDADGRPTSIASPWAGGSYYYTYGNGAVAGPGDRLMKQQIAQVTTTYTSDARGQLIDLNNTVAGGFNNFNDSFTNITYDGSGNRLGMNIAADAVDDAPSASGAIAYTYDPYDRLTSETRTSPYANSPFAYSNTYAYDDPGNMLVNRGQPVLASAYDPDNHLLPNSDYFYDNDGNPTTYAGSALSFDESDNVVSLPGFTTQGQSTQDSLTRSDGLRAWRTYNLAGRPVTTYFYYDGDHLLFEMDNNGTGSDANYAVANVWGWGATGLTQRFNADADFYISYTYDPAGNVVERSQQYYTDNSGNPVPQSVAEYDAFGKPVVEMETVTGSPTTVNEFYAVGFGGQWGYYTDPGTKIGAASDPGFVLCTRRWYDPANCRWLTRDPIGYEGGIDLYAFCDNNPVNGADPSGLLDDGRDGSEYNGAAPGMICWDKQGREYQKLSNGSILSPREPKGVPKGGKKLKISSTDELTVDTDGTPGLHHGEPPDPDHLPDTSVHMNGHALNAAKVPYTVYPMEVNRAQGMKPGDLVVIRFHGTVTAAILGDSQYHFTEASLAVFRNLGWNPLTAHGPNKGKYDTSIPSGSFTIIGFPGSAKGKSHFETGFKSATQIQRAAMNLYYGTDGFYLR